jgi:hypothetical protein
MSESTTDDEIEALQLAITLLSRKIPRLTIIKNAYRNGQFDENEFQTAHLEVASNGKFLTKALLDVFDELYDLLKTLDPSSFSTLNQWIDGNHLGGNRELLIEAFHVGPLLPLILTFPRLDFKERQSTGTMPATYTNKFYDAYPVFSHKEERETEDLAVFSELYNSYIESLDQNFNSLQSIIRLVDLLRESLLKAFNLIVVGPRKNNAAESGLEYVIEGDSRLLFEMIDAVATILLPNRVVRLKKQEGEPDVEVIMDEVQYRPGSSAVCRFFGLNALSMTSIWKPDGHLYGFFPSFNLSFAPVLVKNGIGLESIPSFPYLENTDIEVENTYACIQQLIRYLVTSQACRNGFLIFDSIMQIMEVEINFDAIEFLPCEEGRYSVKLQEIKRTRKKSKNSSNHTVEADPVMVEEKRLPVKVKLHRIDAERTQSSFQIRVVLTLAARLREWNNSDNAYDLFKRFSALLSALLKAQDNSTASAPNREKNEGFEEQHGRKKSPKRYWCVAAEIHSITKIQLQRRHAFSLYPCYASSNVGFNGRRIYLQYYT